MNTRGGIRRARTRTHGPHACRAAALIAGLGTAGFLFVGPDRAYTETRDPGRLCEAARSAYDAGNLAEAIHAFRLLEDAGVRSPELLYNLGNALFLSGDTARAVWYYLRAMRKAPRDQDIQTNLNLALENAGIAVPFPDHPHGRWLRLIRRDEWGTVVRAGYSWAAIFLGVALWVKRDRRIWLRTAGLGLGILAVGGLGLNAWEAEDRHPLAVVVPREGVGVLFAPVEGHTERFHLPAARPVRIIRTDRDWSLVRKEALEGWVPETALALLDRDPQWWDDRKKGNAP